MTRFNEDQRNLEELIEEGLWDRFKTRGAEALGSAKGLGRQLKGGLQQAAGNVVQGAGNLAAKGVQAVGGTIDPANNKLSNKGREFSKQGREAEREGSVSGHNAKVEYLQKNIDKRIRAFANDIKNDIQKLGLDIGNIEFVSEINDALNHLKKSVSGATPPPLPQQSGATPPPLPKQKKAISRKKKPRPTTNPRKSKVMKDPFAKYAAPEQEEDLDKMFWED